MLENNYRWAAFSGKSMKVLTKQDLEQIFDGAATTYDRMGPAIFAGFGERLVQDIPVTRGMKTLDIATGTGAVLSRLASRVGPEGRATGIDMSSSILAEARRIMEVGGHTNFDLQKMDAEQLEFPDRSFDIVTCAFALFMFPDMKLALREMYRVCKPGGKIAITYFNNDPSPFNPGWQVFAQQSKDYQVAMRMPQRLGMAPEEIGNLLSEAGLNKVTIHSELNEIVYPAGEAWWGFLMTLGSRAVILSMDENTRSRFKAEYLAKLEPVRQNDGYHMMTAVIYASANRP
jgi:O-methyltransferase / aklanonic acid methyltransferase